MHSRSPQFIKWLVVIMVSAGYLTGCGGNIFSYKGGKITQDALMIRLQDGDQQGVWRKNEIEIVYRYHNESQSLKLSGTPALITGNKYFNHLAIYALFLDEHGTVMEDVLMYAGENARRIIPPPMDFNKTLPIPSGAMAISFAYDLTPVLSNGR
jgi:hypothetical protein